MKLNSEEMHHIKAHLKKSNWSHNIIQFAYIKFPVSNFGQLMSTGLIGSLNQLDLYSVSALCEDVNRRTIDIL